MKKHAPPISIKRARELRRNPTEAELLTWHLLRNNFPEGRWRRQVPLRHLIADFASHRLRVVIEVDGGQHTLEVDAARTAIIEAEGYRIVRFWNNEILANSEGCMIRLAELLRHNHPNPTSARQQAAKPSYPSPIKGEGN